MKKRILLVPMFLATLGALPLYMAGEVTGTPAQTEQRERLERKFEEYRTAMTDAYKIDIKNFNDKLPGGHADAKPITNYDLNQLLSGINFERDHTKDNMLALELAMDHLERIPDYYRRLAIMDRQYESERLLAW
jgi:uncharacterized protein DUF5661